MYIENMQLIKAKLAAEGRMSQSDIIKQILKDHKSNPAKKAMTVGMDYYDGKHDIYEHNFQESTVYEDVETSNGIRQTATQVTNENNSNHHNVHNFFYQQVNQKTAYIAGKPLSVTVEGSKNDAKLKEFEDLITLVSSCERFADIINDWITYASCKGCEWFHTYYNNDGKFNYMIVPAEEIIPFYDTDRQQELVELLRVYNITMIFDGKETLRKKIEWWTKNDVTYFIENEQGDFVLDNFYSNNPSGHWYDITSLNNVEIKRVANGWGRVPFIPLYNNPRHTSDLQLIKGLQDAYNLISSASTNNQIDLVELYWLVQGYGGETAKAIQKKLRMNKAVHISDPSGKISAEQVTLSVSERIAWLKLLREDIYNLGMAIDTTAQSFATAPSGVALQFLYTPLDMKANMLINKLKLALSEFFWFVTQDINSKNKTAYDSNLIRVDVNKTVITNDAETIENIEKSRNLVPDNLLLAKHPYVDDVNQAEEDLKKQKEEQQKRFLNSDVPFEDDDE